MPRLFTRGEVPAPAELIKQINAETSARVATLRAEEGDEGKKRYRTSISSEEPYERWFGFEILSHEPGAIDMSRAANGLPFLVGHRWGSLPVGRIHDLAVRDRKLGGDVAFGERAEVKDILVDVENGTIQETSVGYEILKMEKVSEEDGVPTWLVTKWRVLEGSLVGVPADGVVGMGRKHEPETGEVREMPKPVEKNTTPDGVSLEEVAVKVNTAREDAVKQERDRIDGIRSTAKTLGVDHLVDEAITKGEDLADFRERAWIETQKDNFTKAPESADIGMQEKDLKRFSLRRLLRAVAEPHSREAQNEAGFERELSEAQALKDRTKTRGMKIPVDVLVDRTARPLRMAQRTMNAGVSESGGMLVETELGSMDDLLKNKMLLKAMGARVITGVSGNLAFPRVNKGVNTYWVGSGEAPPESDPELGLLALTPKEQACLVSYDRNMLIEPSIDIESFLRDEMMDSLALGSDHVGINGDGVKKPLGIRFTDGISGVALGANGGVPTYKSIVNLWQKTAKKNALAANMGWLTNSSVVGTLMTTERAEGTANFIMRDKIDENGMGSLMGYKVGMTEQIPDDLVKAGSGATLSALLFGDFDKFVMVYFGGIDITVDPYTKAAEGQVRLIAYQSMDCGVRYPEAFAMINDITPFAE
ncbi:MAG: phage major capsid protein [bacterium]|nr:phage major capsid protein [bacterium]